MRILSLAITLVAAGLVASSCAGPDENAEAEADAGPSLEEVRAATERFQDVNVALAEGYIRDPMDLCDTAEMLGRPAELGAMGVHYFRPDLLGITEPPDPRVNGTGTHTDFLEPAVVIYEPQSDGSLELVAVENLVFREAAGHTSPPSFHEVQYNLMEDLLDTEVDEAHMFEPFNPAVTCEHHEGATAEAG